MKEYSENSNHIEKIIIGGTLATPVAMEPLYGYLAGDKDSEIPLRERLFALKDGGLGPMEETYQDIRERVLDFKSRHGAEIVAGGHSQGAVHLGRLVMEGVVDNAVMYAGPHKGLSVDTNSAGMRMIKFALGGMAWPMGLSDRYIASAPAVDDISSESEYMRKYQEMLAHNYPADSNTLFITATRDMVVPSWSATGVSPELAKNVRVIIPHLGKFAVWGHSDVSREVRPISNMFPTDHITMNLAPASRKAIEKIRANALARRA